MHSGRGTNNHGAQYAQGQPPPAYGQPRNSVYSGYPSTVTNTGSQMTRPTGFYSAQTPSSYPPTNMTNYTKNTQVSRKRAARVECCDKTYAKSKQGIFKIVLILLSSIAWICVACTPYIKRIFVIGGQTWPFHMVMFFTISAWLALLTVYIIFTSGYHRKRKRKPWPSYEFYFNIWLIVWFASAALIESFNAWRWNYGPHTNRSVNKNHMPSSDVLYDQSVGNNNMGWTHGWDYKRYCQMYRQDCYRRLNAELMYNGYFATHVFVCVCLWVCVVLSVVATYHAYTLHCLYTDMIKGVTGGESKANIKKGYMSAIKKKLKKPKPPSQATQSSVRTVPNKERINSST